MGVEVFEMSTRDVDHAHAVLNEIYAGEQAIGFCGVQDGFTCELRSASADCVGADRLAFSMGMRTTVAPLDYFMAGAGVRGTCHYSVDRHEVALRPGTVFRYPTTAKLSARYDGIETTTVRLPMAALERVAAERFGSAAADLRFDGYTPLDDGLRRGWLQLMAFTQSQLASPASAASSPLVAAALVDLVASSALVTFANTTMQGARSMGGWVAPAVVRRAVAHMEAHAGEALTLSDVARAAGVGPRALQLAFARHLGTSPMAHLRRVRLQGAHRELQAADPSAGDTVAGVARRWGWVSTDRFSAAYRELYGVAPSHTLRT